MRQSFLAFLVVLLWMTGSIWADTVGIKSSLDPFCFLAGIATTGADLGYIAPPQCESFFKAAGEQHLAELFLEMAKSWTKASSVDASAFRFYESGGRFIVENRKLSEALQAFYGPPKSFEVPNVASIDRNREKRMSFLAGIYARCFRDGVFNSRPSVAMKTAVMILLAEGCEVTELTFSENEVPETMHFKVKASARVAQLFATVDQWQPPQVKWEYKEWKSN